MLFGNVARSAADTHDFAVIIEQGTRVDTDPAAVAACGDDVGHVVADLAVAPQQGQEAPVGDVRIARLEIEKAAPAEVARSEPEDVACGVVEVGKAALRVGRPHQIVRGFDEVTVAVFAIQQQLDDALFLGQRFLDRGELFGGFVRADRLRREAVD